MSDKTPISNVSQVLEDFSIGSNDVVYPKIIDSEREMLGRSPISEYLKPVFQKIEAVQTGQSSQTEQSPAAESLFQSNQMPSFDTIHRDSKREQVRIICQNEKFTPAGESDLADFLSAFEYYRRRPICEGLSSLELMLWIKYLRGPNRQILLEISGRQKNTLFFRPVTESICRSEHFYLKKVTHHTILHYLCARLSHILVDNAEWGQILIKMLSEVTSKKNSGNQLSMELSDTIIPDLASILKEARERKLFQEMTVKSKDLIDSFGNTPLLLVGKMFVHHEYSGAVALALYIMTPELLNQSDHDGYTPLHIAVLTGQLEMVSILLFYGVSRTEKDKDGKTAENYLTLNDDEIKVKIRTIWDKIGFSDNFSSNVDKMIEEKVIASVRMNKEKIMKLFFLHAEKSINVVKKNTNERKGVSIAAKNISSEVKKRQGAISNAVAARISVFSAVPTISESVKTAHSWSRFLKRRMGVSRKVVCLSPDIEKTNHCVRFFLKVCLKQAKYIEQKNKNKISIGRYEMAIDDPFLYKTLFLLQVIYKSVDVFSLMKKITEIIDKHYYQNVTTLEHINFKFNLLHFLLPCNNFDAIKPLLDKLVEKKLLETLLFQQDKLTKLTPLTVSIAFVNDPSSVENMKIMDYLFQKLPKDSIEKELSRILCHCYPRRSLPDNATLIEYCFERYQKNSQSYSDPAVYLKKILDVSGCAPKQQKHLIHKYVKQETLKANLLTYCEEKLSEPVLKGRAAKVFSKN